MSLKEDLEHEAAPEPVPAESAEHEREFRELSLKGITLSLVLLVVLVALAMGVSSLVLGTFEARDVARRPEPSPLPREAGPPEPRLETLPGELRRRQEAAQEQILRSYAWLDREEGRVRIPVERAMDVLAERGLPVRREGGGTGGESDPARRRPGSEEGTMERDTRGADGSDGQ